MVHNSIHTISLITFVDGAKLAGAELGAKLKGLAGDLLVHGGAHVLLQLRQCGWGRLKLSQRQRKGMKIYLFTV